jgi:nucleotide-binding universal stress UspA family protein
MIETILLPTDFSETAKNAGLYAVELAFQIGAKKVVVYHTYEVATSLSSIDNTNENIAGELSRQESATKLHEFTKMLQEKVLGSVEIEGYHSYAELPDAIMNLKETTGAQLIVMGITGGNAVKEVFVGSNSVKLARKSPIPVLIVPTESIFNRIREVVLVSDFKDVAATTPVDEIKNMLKATGAHFCIVHVTSNATEAAASPEKAALAEMFKEFHPTFHYETNSNFSEAIDGFVVNHKIDLVVVVPKKHGIFDNMFGVNHTKTLAFRSHVPLLAVQNTEA